MICVVVPSIYELENLSAYKNDLSNYNCHVIVIDEGNGRMRERNTLLLEGLEHEFWGPRERKRWFAAFQGNGRYEQVIPRRCHAETSFGLLVALEKGADVILEIDDDVFPFNNNKIVEGHLENLSRSEAIAISSRSRWYNTLDNLTLDVQTSIWPRGHPYSKETRLKAYETGNEISESILNMGLWSGDPDLDALTILQLGGLDGKGSVHSSGAKRSRIVVNKGTYFAVCSMNTALRSKIVPSFYQLYMKEYGIDRFDDIWSGMFVKRIADHLGDRISLGSPTAFHDKRRRSTFKDLRAELEGMVINETLWRVVDSIELSGRDYFECYTELIDGLEAQIEVFPEKLHRDFIGLQVVKMRLWLRIVDRIY